MDVEEEAEVFEITDFTNASPWESFIAKLEEVFRDWNLHQEILRTDSSTDKILEQKVENVDFAGHAFRLIYSYPEVNTESDVRSSRNNDDYFYGKYAFDDMMKHGDGFPSRAHPIQRWYWIQQFVLLEPVMENTQLSADQSSVLLSSLATAAANTQCCVPLFAQLDRRDRRLYEGLLITPQLKTNFEMAQLSSIPPQYSKLDSLVNVFRGKLESIGCSIEHTAGVDVTVRLTYAIHDWAELNWPTQPVHLPPDEREPGSKDEPFDLSYLKSVPFGSIVEPITQTSLSATWYDHSEKVLHENELSSDLDPMKAPEWSMRVVCKESADGQLGESLLDFLHLCNKTDPTPTALTSKTSGSDVHAKQALNRLANADLQGYVKKSKDVLGAAGRLGGSSSGQTEYLSQMIKEAFLQYIFPDAVGLSDVKVETDTRDKVNDLDTSQLKSAPVDSLTWRIAIVFIWTYRNYDVNAVCQFWHEIMLELRHRWDTGSRMPDLADTAPDLGTCLLHQKLQMLNCCIRKKKEGELLSTTDDSMKPVSSSASMMSSNLSEDQDEFFECNESIDVNLDESSQAGVAEGRLQPCGDMKLLRSDEVLYVPITQEPAPLTEDELEEQAALLAKMGTDSEGTALRAKMQSPTLVADMEAFKAANPNCSLEDFVRWYSPRDYTEEEATTEDGTIQKTGSLSARMLLENNAWSVAWSTARAVPARRQKRLFDETKEAEKVLHFLSSLAAGRVAALLLPVLIKCSLHELHQHIKDIKFLRPSLHTELEFLVKSAARLTRKQEAPLDKIEELLMAVGALEFRVEATLSLRHKLVTLLDTSLPEGLLRDLWSGEPVKLPPDIELRRKVCLVLPTQVPRTELSLGVESSGQPALAPPHAREFLLRVVSSCTGDPPRIAQRMYCVLSRAEFRLAAAFSQPNAII